MLKYYTCECGAKDRWDEETPPDCAGCFICGSTFAQGEAERTARTEHEMEPNFVEMLQEWRGGKCKKCGEVDPNWPT